MRFRLAAYAVALPLAVAFGVGITISPTLAANCKTIASVQQSADPPTNNTGMGGHLTGHINGLAPPPGWSYANKTLFTSQPEYIGAWRNYLKTNTPVLNCAGAGPHQVISVQTLLKKPKIGAISCRNAACTQSNKTQMPNIFFAYVYANGNWILNTAFPSN